MKKSFVYKEWPQKEDEMIKYFKLHPVTLNNKPDTEI